MPKTVPQPPLRRERHAEQLRDAIDRGRTGDKIPVSDPAAAPLGTDDEASGAPPTPEQVAALAQAEMAQRVFRGDERRSNGVILIAILLTVTVTVAAILWTRQ